MAEQTRAANRAERIARNRARRQAWIDAAPGNWLCGACHHYDCGEGECDHPLEVIRDRVWPKMKARCHCWGWKPREGWTIEPPDAAERAARDRGERGEP